MAKAAKAAKTPEAKQIPIDADVVGLLNTGTWSTTVEGDPALAMPTTSNRKLYEKTAKVLGSLGGKWSRKHAATIFPSDPAAETAVREACATGTYVDSKQLFQFFETPHDVATRMLDELPTGPGAYDVLEPNAGDGALVRVALSMRRRGLAAFDLGREVRVTAIELDPKRCARLRTEFSPGSGVERVLERDFLTVTPEETGLFDWILMNPPFSRGQDMAHVRHAFEFLRAGGTLVAIMSPGFEYRSDAASALFRDWLSLRQSADMASWHPLPEGSFKTSGTNVRTVMLTIKRGK